MLYINRTIEVKANDQHVGLHAGCDWLLILQLYKAGFTPSDSLPSLLDRAIICQCKHSGARARPRVFQQPALPEP